MSKTAEEYSKEFDAMYGDHTPDLPTSKAEQAALDAYPDETTQIVYQELIEAFGGKTEVDFNLIPRLAFQQGYEQAEKDINKELMDIMADIREKQEKAMYADYDIHIDTSNASDTSVAYVFKGDKVVDLLTWEDIKEIQRLCDVVWSEQEITAPIDEDTIYKEVLRRFKKVKEDKK